MAAFGGDIRVSGIGLGYVILVCPRGLTPESAVYSLLIRRLTVYS